MYIFIYCSIAPKLATRTVFKSGKIKCNMKDNILSISTCESLRMFNFVVSGKCIFMFPCLLCIIPTVILFHLFKLDQTAALWEECVMGYVRMEALSGANGSSWFEWPIYEHFMWVMECSPNVLQLATQQHSFRWADAVNVNWKRK